MTLKEFKNKLLDEVEGIYGKEETESFYYLLIQHYLGFTKVEAILNADTNLENPKLQELENAIAKLKLNKPIQYIIGETEFFSLPFKVNRNVLIPRLETEELVDWIIKDFNIKSKSSRILDVGTGSGCIAITLTKFLKDSTVTGLDFSLEALKVANENADINKVEVELIQQDILQKNLQPKLTQEKWDVIVSNPPYVRDSEKLRMHSNVLDYEPESALFVTDADPLIFYRRIAEFAFENLEHNGNLYFEINEDLGKEMIQLLEDLKFEDIRLRKDLFGKDRMIKATKI
ncbi:release factor glutamine methyltransferase [Flavobacteriaceae bacterium MAR_2010_188]|nr:release factor glutamine methyltransferase [Flavobacteriaceae bacterium MAR_2010_188]